MYPMRPGHQQMLGRAILTRAVAHIEDALDDPELAQHLAQAGGFRGMLAVPMLCEGSPIGAIFVTRGQPGPFSETQIELLKTFAAQARPDGVPPRELVWLSVDVAIGSGKRKISYFFGTTPPHMVVWHRC